MKKSKPQKSAKEKKSEEELSDKPDMPEEFLIVGIGASAGGVQALKEFFKNVPADSGMAYVVILHLSPDHDSQLASVLQAVAAIPVTQVKKRVKVEPNRVYVVPPNEHLEMFDGEITVSKNLTVEDRRAPVDIFFRTLAESHHARAVAVVLSGTGANGSMGIKRVKERGGAAFVQNPREAEFNEMPRNSIATDLIDQILNVAEIPARIIAYKESLGKIEIPVEAAQRPEDTQQALREIFTQLRLRTGHDFSNYKRPTILRRIERRINVFDLPDLTSYARFVRENRDETTALLKDLLISVTNFFRDKNAFHHLEHDILPKIFHGKTGEDQVRIWVAGCATGEEAYSLAMLCAERTLDAVDAPVMQIFATDIDEQAISTAREGFYTLNDAADVSPERMQRFFTKENDGYRVRRELREMILFANHNVIKDPPFSRLDAVTCRNMLIYLNPTAQERVMETFHFALNPGGFLFLGNSESVDGAGDLYATVSKENHIFQSRHATARTAFPVPDTTRRFPDTAFAAMRDVLPLATTTSVQAESNGENGRGQNQTPERISFGNLHRQLLELYAPPSIVVNEEYDIVHLSERAGRFLQIAGGEPTKNLLKLIRPELRLELRSALYQAVHKQTNVEIKNLKTRDGERDESVNIYARPVLKTSDDTARGFILVLFETAQNENVAARTEAAEKIYAAQEPVARQLEEELLRTKSQLRNTIEQFEVQAEELKASNEELQALNEELRSSSEELETSKEELQSLNEELITVNQELKVKIEEVSQTSNDFQNLIISTDVATLFLDRAFRVHTFTPAASRIFNLIPADTGRPITDITHRLEQNGLLHDAKTVLKTLQTVEREARTIDGQTYLLRVLPYRTNEDRINGVVATFLDITERKRVEDKVRESEERLQKSINIETVGVLFFNNDIEITDCNDAFVRMSGYTRQELLARRFSWEAFTPDGFVEVSNRAIEELNTIGTSTPYEKEYVRKDGSRFWALFAAKRIGENEIVEFVTDITEQKRAEEAVRRSEARQTYLLKLGDALRPLSDPLQIQRTAMRVLGEHLQADRALYSEIEPDDRHFVIADNYARGNYPKMIGRFPLSDFGNAQKSQRVGETLVLSDIRSAGESDEHAAFLAAGVQALIGVPLHKDGRWVASLTVHQGSPRAWSPEDAALVSETAERTWAAVERARAEAALAASEEKYRTLFDSIDEGVSTIELIYDENGRAVDYYLLEQNQALTEQTGLPREAVGKRISEVIPNLEAFWFETFERAAATGEPQRFEHTVAGLANNCFDVYVSRVGGDGSRTIVLVYNNITERKRHEANLAFLAETSADFAPLLSAEELLERVGKRVGDFLGLSHCNFSVVDAEADRIECIYEWRADESSPSVVGAHRVSDFLNEAGRRHYAAGEISVIGDLRDSLMLGAPPEMLAALGIRSVVHAPSLNDGRWEFLLTAARSEAGEWRDDEVALIRELADRIYIRVERARAEEALRKSEERLRLATEAGGLGAWEWNLKTDEVFWNEQHFVLFGMQPRPNPLRAEEFFRHVQPDERERIGDLLQESIRERTVFDADFRVVLESGEGRWMSGYGRIVEETADGEPLKMSGLMFDITERKRAEEALRESENRYRALAGQTTAGITELDLNGFHALANPGYCETLGYTEAELLEMNLRDVTHPDDYAHCLELFEDTIKNGTPHVNEKRIVRKDGSIVWITDSISRITDHAGNALRVATIAIDITDRRRAEIALRESEGRLRLATEAAEMYSWEFDAESGTYEFSENAASILGVDRKNLPVTVEDTFALVHPDDRRTVQATLERALQTGEGFTLDLRSIKESGEIVWLSVQTTIAKDARGKVVRVIGITQDVTERRRAEEALRESEERLRLLIESASDYAIFTMTPDNIIDSWNAGAEKVFGYNEQEIVGKSGAILFTAEDRERGVPAMEIECAAETGKAEDERWHIREDGSRFYASGVMRPLKDGKVMGFVKIARDQTERIKAEKAVRDRETLQKLVGAQEDERKRIARDLHDHLGQQLTALRLKLEAVRKLCDGGELCGQVDETQLIARQIDADVDFLAWELRPAALDDLGLIAALDNYVKEWSRHSGITAEFFSSGLGKTRLAPEIETNLYRIAQEALNNASKHARARGANVILEKRGSLIILIIEDDGVGFDVENKTNRTKGLGLLGMQERAALVGGKIQIESTSEKGTTVFVRISLET